MMKTTLRRSKEIKQKWEQEQRPSLKKQTNKKRLKLYLLKKPPNLQKLIHLGHGTGNSHIISFIKQNDIGYRNELQNKQYYTHYYD